MDTITRNKWQVRAAAIIIFLLGVAVGTLAPRVYYTWLQPDRRTGRQDIFEEMLDRVQLTAEQKTQVQQILGDTREQLHALRRESEPRVKEIQHQADERLRQVLTPEQWQRFQQVKDEMRGRRRGRGRRGNGPGKPLERESMQR